MKLNLNFLVSKLVLSICLVTYSYCCLNAQNRYYNRPQVTFLFHNSFNNSEFFNELIDSLSKKFINLPMFPEETERLRKETGKFPNQVYFPLFNYDNNSYVDNKDSNSVPIFSQFEYNPVDKAKVAFSFLEIYNEPKESILPYAIEILQYNFNSNGSNPYNFDRINKRSLINAKDNEFELSKNIQRGDNIIKDDIDKIFSNVFIIGVEPIGFKIKKSKLIELEFLIITFKIVYDFLLLEESFWNNCFQSKALNLCQEKKDLIYIGIDDAKTIKIELDPNNNPMIAWTFEQRVYVHLIDKIKSTFIK
ncbi:MAG: hypothetical protein FJY17_03640 [Bacteroidetes bacterium]|nr:hypothetical protein [Bacteroidota bacterium]